MAFNCASWRKALLPLLVCRVLHSQEVQINTISFSLRDREKAIEELIAHSASVYRVPTLGSEVVLSLELGGSARFLSV